MSDSMVRTLRPYYGNCVQQKYNRPDARATPSGILIITFYSNIGLRRNQLHWKANKKLCKLIIWTANRNFRTALHPEGKIVASGRPAKIQEIFRIAFQTQLPVRTPKATVQTHVLETLILTRIRASKAYK
jgi:hypothetical protein